MKNEKNNVIAFRPRAAKTIAKNDTREDNEPVEDQLRNVDWEAKKAKVKALYQAKTRDLDRDFQSKLNAAQEASKELKDVLGRISDTDAFAKEVSSKIAEDIAPKITNSFMARMESSMESSMEADVGRPLIEEMTNRTLKSSQEIEAALKNDIREVASKFFMIVYGSLILVAAIICYLNLE